MADGVTFDFSDIDKLVADLGTVPNTAGPLIRKAVEITSLKIKRDWQEPLKGSATLPALPYALGFDVKSDGRTIESEIGFDLARNQGPLGGISEFGSPTITGRGYGLASLRKNQDDFVKGLEIALEQAQKRVGL